MASKQYLRVTVIFSVEKSCMACQCLLMTTLLKWRRICAFWFTHTAFLKLLTSGPVQQKEMKRPYTVTWPSVPSYAVTRKPP